MATERLRQKQDGREEQAIRAEVHLVLSKLFPDPSATEPSALTRHELKCAHAALTGVKPGSWVVAKQCDRHRQLTGAGLAQPRPAHVLHACLQHARQLSYS